MRVRNSQMDVAIESCRDVQNASCSIFCTSNLLFPCFYKLHVVIFYLSHT